MKSPTSIAATLAAPVLDARWPSLAKELAQDIIDAPTILKTYGFSGPDDPAWVATARNPAFQQLLREAKSEWMSADSTAKRIRVKAQTVIEAILPDMMQTLTDPNVAAGPKNDAMRMMMRLGGLDSTSPTGKIGEGGGFQLIVNIGQKQVKVETNAPVIDGFAELREEERRTPAMFSESDD